MLVFFIVYPAAECVTRRKRNTVGGVLRSYHRSGLGGFAARCRALPPLAVREGEGALCFPEEKEEEEEEQEKEVGRGGALRCC